MTPIQIRMARAGALWSKRDLSNATGISQSIIDRIERETVIGDTPTLAAIRSALESTGAIFLDETSDGPGVRLKPNSFVRLLPGSGLRQPERDADIARRKDSGETFTSIGRDLGLSPGRVAQLYYRETRSRRLAAGGAGQAPSK